MESSKEHRNTESRQFQCPRDGHFGDGVDCAKFYRCAHGSAIVEYCPGGLFFNARKCFYNLFMQFYNKLFP